MNKLKLEKFRISELKNQEAIIGGNEMGTSVIAKTDISRCVNRSKIFLPPNL